MQLPQNDLKETFATLLRNKFVVASLIFLTWITFFDEDNLINKQAYASKIAQLEKEKQTLANDIKQDQRKMDELRNNRESLEKFAREEYFMKKNNETIFIIK
ncbi:MAG: septum formation initiator family protein [Bacteroidales bacterium]|nr:septum formation initiator family protein [Bacteroidales bacterium]